MHKSSVRILEIEKVLNYIEDIYLVPHLRNHFILTGKNMEQKILKANCISKQICFSMNKEKNRILNHLRYDLNIKQVFVERQCWGKAHHMTNRATDHKTLATAG